MRLLAVVLVRTAEADVGANGDEARALVGAGGLDGGLDGGEIIAVRDTLRVPAVGIEPPRHILRPRHRGRTIELDPVVVVQDDELAKPQVPGQAGRLRGDPLLHVAVGRDDVGPMIDDRVVQAVELLAQAALRDGHPDGIRKALAERAGGGLDARGEAVFRVARRDAAPLAEGLQIIERDGVAGQVQERVEQHAGVARAQDEPVAIRPVRVGRGVAQEACPEDVRHRRGTHGGARVSRVRLLDRVDGEGSDRVDRELVEVGGDSHRGGLRSVEEGRASRWFPGARSL
jgi:hypothetical protein